MKQLLLVALMISAIPAAKASNTQNWKPKYQTSKTSSSLTQGKDVNFKVFSKVGIQKEFKSEDLVVAPATKTTKKSTKLIKPINPKVAKHPLTKLYLKKYIGKIAYESLKVKTAGYKQEAVPVLIEVMKSAKFPEKNRWTATFMLGRIMGVKAAPFIAKFVSHPSWMLRLASLKTLAALNQNQFKGLYARAIKDKALIVRFQALENIRTMKIKDLAPHVWGMLYNKANYAGQKGQRKRAHIIKNVIKTMGELGFKKAKKPMLAMIQKKKYSDIYQELDYSLSKLSKKKSPKGGMTVKKYYWSKIAISETTI